MQDRQRDRGPHRVHPRRIALEVVGLGDERDRGRAARLVEPRGRDRVDAGVQHALDGDARFTSHSSLRERSPARASARARGGHRAGRRGEPCRELVARDAQPRLVDAAAAIVDDAAQDVDAGGLVHAHRRWSMRNSFMLGFLVSSSSGDGVPPTASGGAAPVTRGRPRARRAWSAPSPNRSPRPPVPRPRRGPARPRDDECGAGVEHARRRAPRPSRPPSTRADLLGVHGRVAAGDVRRALRGEAVAVRVDLELADRAVRPSSATWAFANTVSSSRPSRPCTTQARSAAELRAAPRRPGAPASPRRRRAAGGGAPRGW